MLLPLLTWSAGQVRVISTPCSTGRVGSVTTLLHVESTISHFDSEIIICTILHCYEMVILKIVRGTSSMVLELYVFVLQILVRLDLVGS